MGLRGPAARPSAWEAASGNPLRPKDKDRAKLVDAAPAMPDYMSERAIAIWDETVPILLSVPGLLTAADGPVLADYCEVRARKEAIQLSLRVEERRAVAEVKAVAVRCETCGGDSRTSNMQCTDHRPMNIDLEAAMLDAMRTTEDLFGDKLDRLRRREITLRRELGMSPSGRSSIHIAGTDNTAKIGDADDDAMFGSGPQLVHG